MDKKTIDEVMNEIIISPFSGAYCAKKYEPNTFICAENLPRRLEALHLNFANIDIKEFKILSVYCTKNKTRYDINLDLKNYNSKSINLNKLSFEKHVYTEDRNGDDGFEKCLCGMKIMHIYIIHIKCLNINVQIGSRCVEKFNDKLGGILVRIQNKISDNKIVNTEFCQICGTVPRDKMIDHIFIDNHQRKFAKKIRDNYKKNIDKINKRKALIILLKNLDQFLEDKIKFLRDYNYILKYVDKNYMKCLDCDLLIKKSNYKTRCLKCYWQKNGSVYKGKIVIDDIKLIKYYEYKKVSHLQPMLL